MKKQIIYGISNRNNYVCLEIDKNSSYYNFLFKLLKEFNISPPDIQEINGSSPNIVKITDSYGWYETNSIEINEVIGHKKVFLIIKTNLRKKLSKFIENYCDFYKKN